jgi:hypothetical protein
MDVKLGLLKEFQDTIKHFSTIKLSGKKVIKRRELLNSMYSLLTSAQEELKKGLMDIGNKTEYNSNVDSPEIIKKVQDFINDLDSTIVSIPYEDNDEKFLTIDELDTVTDHEYTGYIELKLIDNK